MKTCGYCGRENEDSAIVCRECGLSEFLPTAEEKARAAQTQAMVEPEPEIPEPDVASGEEASICPFCLFPNLPDREWCKNCGTPFNTSVMGPFESALARGFMYRGIVRGRPKPIVLVTVWISCAPIALLGLIAIMGGIVSGLLPLISVGILCFAIPGSILFQVTRNFLTIPKPKFDD
jgi:hypothetical protein